MAVGHPAWAEESELRGLGVPTQIVAPEFDKPFNPELRKFANETVPTLGVPYSYQYFPGVVHRFASQPVREDEKEMAAFERAQIVTVSWLRQFL